MATMDELTEEILAEIRRVIVHELEAAPDMLDLEHEQPFIDLDHQVPPPVRLPTDPWVEILTDAKDEFEVDGTAAVFSTWRVGEEDPLDISDVEVADGVHARAGRLARIEGQHGSWQPSPRVSSS